MAHLLRVHYWAIEQHLIASDPVFRERGLALIRGGAIIGVGFSQQSSRPAGLNFDPRSVPTRRGWRLNGTKFYCTGTLYSDHTQIWGAAPGGRIAGAIIPVDREGVTVEDDWDGFGQRLTGSGTTRLDDVHVADAEYFDLGAPEEPSPPNHLAPFLQLYLQAVMAGILRSVRNDAIELVRRRKRGFSHAAVPQRPQTTHRFCRLSVRSLAAAFAAEAVVLAAADAIQERPRTRPWRAWRTAGSPPPHSWQLRRRRSSSTGWLTQRQRSGRCRGGFGDAGGPQSRPPLAQRAHHLHAQPYVPEGDSRRGPPRQWG